MSSMVLKRVPLWPIFRAGKSQKSLGVRSGGVRWLGDDRNAFLGKELLHNKGGVARCVIVMQKPLSLPLVASFHPKCIAQPLQTLHVEMTTVLSGSRSEWLLVVLYSENAPQGDAFRNHGGHQIECDGRTPEDSKRSLPPVLPTMVGSMEQLCVCARVLLWKWLGKRCHMSYHYSAMPDFQELFDCPSYRFCKPHSGKTRQEISI